MIEHRATAEQESIDGKVGVRFTTDARPDTEEERKLQEIQAVLSDGVVVLPEATTLPHLALVLVMVEGGPSYSVISLWVPADRRSEAVHLLEDAGFTVS